VKTARIILIIALPLLFSCFPKKPELAPASVPAAPLLSALELHRQSFISLKAVASMELRRRSRKRTLDPVGIVLDGQRRFRLEVYSPLGQSLTAIVWDGRELLLRPPGQDRVVRPGPAGLERIFGKGLDPSELCAVLSGTIPDADESQAALSCGRDGICLLELRKDDRIRQVRLSYSPAEPDRTPRILSHALYRSGKLLYEARFERFAVISRYPLPTRIVVENPGRKLQMTVAYSDAEVNTPLSEEAFSLTDVLNLN
jgi:outer membrane lipoprotein-sorting protein